MEVQQTFSLYSKGTLNFEAYHCHSNINRSLAASTVHTVHAVTSMLWKISSVPSSGTLFSIDFLSSPCILRPIRLAFSRKTQLAFQACRIDRSDRWCVEYEELGLRHDLHLGFRWQMVLWWCRNWRVWNTPRNLSTCETANDIWIFVLPTFTFRETFLFAQGLLSTFHSSALSFSCWDRIRPQNSRAYVVESSAQGMANVPVGSGGCFLEGWSHTRVIRPTEAHAGCEWWEWLYCRLPVADTVAHVMARTVL